MTTFNDIFKSSFLEKVSSFSLLDMGLAMLLSLLLGLFIFAVYRKTFSGVMYSASFGASLVAMTLVTTLIILAVTSNVILSLGMVGALSIVRFRTAIKEPMDIAFLFWSISAGIVTGAGLLPLAVLGSLFIGIFLVLFVNKKSTDNPYILVVSCAGDEARGGGQRLCQPGGEKIPVEIQDRLPERRGADGGGPPQGHDDPFCQRNLRASRREQRGAREL